MKERNIKKLSITWILLSTVFDEEKLSQELSDISKELENPNIYSDMPRLSALSKKQKLLSDELNKFKSLKSKVLDMKDILDMVESGDDESVRNELNGELNMLDKNVQDMYIQTLLSGEYDNNNAILKIHSGAGGTEACDWVSMLYKMYLAFAEKNGYKIKLLDSLDGDGAGFKSVTFMVSGENAYGYLKGETGVHRLVRISPFDANKRRHTSFASVEVMPEIDNDINVDLKEEDLKIDTYRSSGAGGQHVNTTDSAIRITHIPTGIVVTCQNERSQLQNKEMAKRMLMGKLVALEIQKNLEKASAIKGESKKIEWGSQIRSYVFCPYKMVKDLRTDYETSNLDAVMGGDIIDMLQAYLKWFNGKGY